VKAIITYHNNDTGLAVTLASLQAQIIPPEEIIVIDTSPTKSGLDICQRYATNSVPIKVECARVGIYEAWNRGIDLAGVSDVVILNDDLLLPLNFIDILALVRENVPALCIVPQTPNKDHYKDKVDAEFRWYSPLPQSEGDLEAVKWMPGFCFMLTAECVKQVGLFDTKYKVWFGDDDYQQRILKTAKGVVPILRINPLQVYHYGGTSYHYKSKEVQRQIDRDRKLFLKRTNGSLHD
jgi:GT2 family glycosyltransferase